MAGATHDAVDANQRLIEGLEDERRLLQLTERDRAVDQAVRRLSADATADQVAQVRELAGALYDERAALQQSRREAEVLKRLREQLADVTSTMSEAAWAAAQAVAELGEAASTAAQAEAEELARRIYYQREGLQLTEQMLTSQARYARELAHLDELLAAGAVSADTYARAHEDAYRRMLEASTEWEHGVERAWLRYRDAAYDSAAQAEQLFTTAMRGMEDALVQMTLTGEFSFERMTNAIIEDMVRMFYQQQVLAPLGNWLFGTGSGGSGGFFSGIGDWFAGQFGKGAAFDRGDLIAFAGGGIIDEPTLFPLAGGRVGLMGETGPRPLCRCAGSTTAGLASPAMGSRMPPSPVTRRQTHGLPMWSMSMPGAPRIRRRQRLWSTGWWPTR